MVAKLMNDKRGEVRARHAGTRGISRMEETVFCM